jgi:hypothetical protein
MRTLLVSMLALSLSACFVVRTKPAPRYKNHGQARSEEVHERNDARKAAKNEDKNEGKAHK